MIFPLNENIQRHIERFKEIEKLNPNKAMSILKRNWIYLYVKNNKEDDANRQIMLEKPLDEIISAFNKIQPSRFYEMVCEFNAIMIVLWSSEQKFPVEMQMDFFNQFYLTWKDDLSQIDIYNFGLSPQDSADIVFNFLTALAFASVADVVGVFHYYTTGNNIQLEKSKLLGVNKSIDNAFIKSGDIYEIFFLSKSIKIKNSVGLQYIEYLVRRPYSEIHVNELELIINKQVAEGCGISLENLESESLHIDDGTSDFDVAADEKTIKAVQVALNDTNEELEIANEDGNIEQIESLKDTKVKYESYLNEVLGKNYKPRKNINANEKARKRVWAAITDSLHKIKLQSTDLYKHLFDSIKKREFCVYNPKEKIDWR
ncbi:MAG TPA: hypothetical protein VHZ76_05450 [Gammaproteobacteria bacterium]|jgi:hypothetical protein|nr:hypothetical protein [Gammaproteobacteria bacterium]